MELGFGLALGSCKPNQSLEFAPALAGPAPDGLSASVQACRSAQTLRGENVLIRLIWLLLPVGLLLQGCVGLAAGTYGKHEVEYDRIAFQDQRGGLGGVVRPGGYTRSEVIELWGLPDSIREEGECDVLVYARGVSWAGVGVFLGFFPIPIAVPTGRYYVRLYLRDESVVRVVQETGDVGSVMGYMCGSNECAWLFGRNPTAQEKRVDVDWCGT